MGFRYIAFIYLYTNFYEDSSLQLYTLQGPHLAHQFGEVRVQGPNLLNPRPQVVQVLLAPMTRNERISANGGGRSEGLRPRAAGYVRGGAPNKTGEELLAALHPKQKTRPFGPRLALGAMWGSNPRQPEPQSGALPTELIAPC